MNIPDDKRCEWTTVGIRSIRCMCPAVAFTSKFCIFHRHAETVDAAGITIWSQDASREDFDARAKDFIYGKADNPHIAALRAGLKPGRSSGLGLERMIEICRQRGSGSTREPGQDEAEAA